MATAVTPAPEREADPPAVITDTSAEVLVKMVKIVWAETQGINNHVKFLFNYCDKKIDGIDMEIDSLRKEVFWLKVVLLPFIIGIMCGVLSELIKVKQAIVAEEAKF